MTTEQAKRKTGGRPQGPHARCGRAAEGHGRQAGEKVTELRSRLAVAIESGKATCHRLEEKTVAAAKVKIAPIASIPMNGNPIKLTGGSVHHDNGLLVALHSIARKSGESSC